MSPYAFGAYGVTVDEFNNAYTIGQYINTIDVDGTPFTSEGLQDEIIVKYDPTGNVLWATSIGGTQSDWAGSIVYDGVGNVWVTGQFSGTLNAGSLSITSNGGKDAYLVKIDAASGIPLFASNGGGSSTNDDGNDIASDGAGTIYLFGDAGSTNFTWGGLSMIASGSHDAFVIKFNNSGTPQWISKCSGTGADFTYAGAVDPAGNAYLSGVTFSSTLNVNSNPISVGTNDHFITKFDANGNEVWTNLFDGGGNIYGITADDLGNVYFTMSGSPGTYGPFVVTNTNGGGDAFLGKLNNSGTWSWLETFGGTGQDEGLGVDCDQDGNVYWTGTFEGNMNMGSFALSSNSLKKSFYAKVDSSGTVQWALNSKGSTDPHFTYAVCATTGDDVWFSGFGSGHIVIANDSIGLSLGYAARITDNANLIKGIVFSDGSNDGVLNFTEPGIPNVMVQLDANNFVVSSNLAGEFNLFTISGAYDVSIPYPPLYHTLTTPAIQSANFIGLGACDSLNHFGFYPSPNMNDLRISISPITAPKAGYVLGYILTYKNVGTTALNAMVDINADANLDYLMASPSPSSQNGQLSSWNLGVINPGTVENIFIYYNIPTTMQIGDPLVSSASISPSASDQTPGDNLSSSTSLVVGPYDPNYKWVNNDTLINVTSPSWLEYEIHFQNLGNAPAYDVLIADTLPSQFLEMASMEIITSSHSPMNLSITDGNVAKFFFPGIMLPDSLSDPLGSMGMVKFRIKQNGTLPIGQFINNFADIYFDFNPAIRTDTATTLHTSFSGIAEVSDIQMKVYPNPTKSILNIELISEGKICVAQITDMSGRAVLTHILNSKTGAIYLDNLSSGMYLLQVHTSLGHKKMLIEKY
jgi:uncharacterized repeat protein (TIGR01451 family)